MSNLLQMMVQGMPAPPTYSDDVFSAYTYTGNGSTQTITNGIDLAGKGGLVWIKGRSSWSHYLTDSATGANKELSTDSTAAQAASGYVTALNSNGFALAAVNGVNQSTSPYVAWTFRKAPKFFDIVTYTGNGANRTISHSLGAVPGLILVKRLDNTGSWMVYHRSLANTKNLVLNTTAAEATNATAWNSTTADASVFSLGTHADVNTNAATYVAYLFGHDTSTDGLIQCGTFATDGSGNATVALGWGPQLVMWKRSDGIENWRMWDTARGLTASVNGDLYLIPNASSAESSLGAITINAAGFAAVAATASATYVYLVVRRPNKPPTLGTHVFNALARTGTGAAATVTGVGFAPDLVALHSRSGTTGGRWEDRLRGATIELVSETTAAEGAVAQSVTAFSPDGFSVGTDGDWNTNTATYIDWFFRRAPGVFDEVCYTGTGSAHTEAHQLGAVPELMIVKGRSGATAWTVYAAGIANTEKLILNTTAAKATDTTAWNSTTPTASVFTVGTLADVNTNAATYVAYLFATKAGISKVGSYTGGGNMLTYSEEFDNAAWTKARVSVAGGSINATTAPDGTLTADKLVEDTTASSTHLIEGVVSVVSGATYTFSCYVKAAERSTVLVQMYIGFSAGVTVNLSTGATSNSGSPISVSATQAVNGFWRIAVTATSTTTGNGFFDIYTSNGSTVTYTGDGTSGLYIWGAQLNPGTLEDYVQTTSAPAKRINCGFSTGARFVLIKRTDSIGDWLAWDSVRGIVAGNDPHLSLNTTVAEVTTDDSIDPDATGFIANELAATHINVAGASYVYLAIA